MSYVEPAPCPSGGSGSNLTCATDSVTVCQGTIPWVVEGTIVVTPVNLDCLTDSVTVCQGTTPWVVSGTDFDIRPLDCATDSVTICPGADPIPVTFNGTISVALDCATDSVTICPGVDPIPVTQSGVWTTGRTWDLNFATDQVDASGSVVALDGPTLTALETVTVLQGTSPWVVSGAVTVSNFPASQVVTATDLDIRNLDCLTDSVTVCVVDPLPVATVVGFQTRSDTYTVPGNGVTVNRSTDPLKTYAIQVTGTGGSATTWDVRLEGSLDGVNFTEIVRHTTVDGNSTTKWSGANLSPSLYFRSRCVTLTLAPATNIVVVILGSN